MTKNAVIFSKRFFGAACFDRRDIAPASSKIIWLQMQSEIKKLNAKTRCAEQSRSIGGLAVKSIKKTIEMPMVFLLCSKLRAGGIWRLFL
ncbi:hypothetical protein [Pseudoramibacter faecis]|uniref:hypothetical protein n=1 Tax=Pseudoramibacter faecis TaxID=3108534 RepID=UPI002E76F590|nr:hypothetical protein [Pseudoramibacter sp. HA2172]